MLQIVCLTWGESGINFEMKFFDLLVESKNSVKIKYALNAIVIF